MRKTVFSEDIEVPTSLLPPDLDQTGAALEDVKYNPRTDWYSDVTQRIANRLPQWNKIRRRKQTIGQELLNGLFGQSMSDLEDLAEKEFRSQFLKVMPLDDADVVLQVTLPETVDLDAPRGLHNFLRNGYFQIWSYPHQLPDRWVTTTTNTNVVSGLVGHNALQLGVSSSSTNSVYEDINLRIRSGESWTASGFYKIQANAFTKPDDGFGIKLTATLTDGATETAEAVFEATTNGSWQRLTLTTSFTKEVTKLRFEVTIKDEAGFLFSGNTVDVDCLQLEIGSQATSWRPRVDDRYPYMETTQTSPVLIAGSDSATFVFEEDDFWVRSFPTRAELVRSEPAVVPVLSVAGRFQMTDFYGQIFAFSYSVQSGRLRFRDEDHTDDIVRDFYLAFRNVDGFYQIKDSWTLEAITFFAGHIWVVGTNTNEAGDTIRGVYVVHPGFPWPAPTYLQVISGALIPGTAIPAGETLISMEFRNEDRQLLYLFTAATLYIVRLRYDIFTISRAERRALLREDYPTVVVV